MVVKTQPMLAVTESMPVVTERDMPARFTTERAAPMRTCFEMPIFPMITAPRFTTEPMPATTYVGGSR